MTKMLTTAIKMSGSHNCSFENIECIGFDVAMDISDSNTIKVSSLSARDCKKVLKLRKVCDSRFEKINVKLNGYSHKQELNQFKLTELSLSIGHWISTLMRNNLSYNSI